MFSRKIVLVILAGKLDFTVLVRKLVFAILTRKHDFAVQKKFDFVVLRLYSIYIVVKTRFVIFRKKPLF